MKLYQTTKNRRTIVVCSARQYAAVPSALGDGLVGYSSRVGELGHSGKYNEPAREFVRCAQIPALVVAQRKGCWNVKIAARRRSQRKSGQMVVNGPPCAGHNTAPIGQQPLFSFSTKIMCIDTGYFFHSRSFAPCQYGGSVHVRQNDMGGALYAFKARLNRETRITVP